MAMLNPTSSHHLKSSIMPSTSYVPTFCGLLLPPAGGLWPLDGSFGTISYYLIPSILVILILKALNVVYI